MALAMGSCSTIPIEYSSPCACDYKPLNENADEKAIT